MKYPDTCFQVHQVQEIIREWGRRREGRILESFLLWILKSTWL